MKKSFAVIALLLACLFLFAGCASNVAKKSEHEVTLFVDVAIEEPATQAAIGYTDSDVNENANKQSLIIFNAKASADLLQDVKDGVYCDIILVESAAEAPAGASKAWDAAVSGADYTAYIMNDSDNPEAAKAFADYLKANIK